MTDENKTSTGEDPLKKITIAALTFVFVALYVFAIIRVWKGDTGSITQAIALLQPIVYVIIGYYFGRLPAEKVEKQLKDEAAEKDKKATDAAAAAHRATTKLEDVRKVLSTPAAGGARLQSDARGLGQPDEAGALRGSVAHALAILEE